MTTTRSLASRLLFPANPPPPLLADPELSAEVYDVIALALRAYVVPWWSKISRYDKHFLPDITRILAAVIRALDARVQAADTPLLLLRHVPAIVTQHYADYRSAHAKLATSYASGGAASLPQLFHQLQPHMALSPDGRIDTEYFRQLVDHVLKACLPDEDYQPDPERFIIRELVIKLVLTDIIPKLTQPWFVQKCILDLLDLHDPPPPLPSPSAPPPSFSFHTLVVFVLSAIQTVSGACLALIQAYKQAVGTIKRVNSIHPNDHIHPMTSPTSSSSTTTSSSSITPAPPPGNYASPPLAMVAEIFTLDDRLASTVLLTTAQMLTTLSTSFLDRLLPHLLASFFSPAFLLNITRTSKRTLFPNGYPGPPPIEPTPEEQAETRARLVAWRPSGPLAHFIPLLLGPDPSETLGHALDPLSSAPCNVHLVLLLLDCVLGTLFPELLGDAAG